MVIQDYLRVLREQWLVVLVALALGLAGGGAAFFLLPAEYTAKLTMYVSSQGGDTTSAAYQGAQLSQQRVTSYVELVRSRRVCEDVIRRLGLSETPDALSSRITTTSALDSVLIDVAVVDRDPARAALLANTVGEVFTGLVSELERPVQPGAPQAVAARVVQPAAAPLGPSSTGLPETLALGLLAGLALGVGGALARNALDVSVKSPDQLREAAGAANLGTIAYNPEVPKRPLTVHEDPQSPRSEAFRQLRTNLQFVDIDNPRKVIVVTSAMPAAGKTTTVVNLAIAMSSAGGRVLVIEADLRRPKVADLLGLEGTAGLTSALSGRVRVEQVIQPWGGGAFDVLASGPLPPNPSELLASRHMGAMLRELREQYDTILIDTPPLLPVTDAAAIAPATDGAILVCRFKQTTRIQVETAVQALSAVSAPLLGTVFTMVPRSGPRAYAQYNSCYRTEQPVVPALPPVLSNGHRPPPAASNGQRPPAPRHIPGPPQRPSPQRLSPNPRQPASLPADSLPPGANRAQEHSWAAVANLLRSIPISDQDRAADRDDGPVLAPAPGDAPVASIEGGVGLARGDGPLAEDPNPSTADSVRAAPEEGAAGAG